MSQKIKAAVIGVGHLGKEHARIYHALETSELVAVCDTNETNGRAIAEKYNTRFVGDYRELLGAVEAVSVATPTINHHEATCAFLEAGVGVLVEIAEKIDMIATSRHVTGNRAIIDLLEDAIAAYDARRKTFLELADRFQKSTDPAETQQLREELARMTFGN